MAATKADAEKIAQRKKKEKPPMSVRVKKFLKKFR